MTLKPLFAIAALCASGLASAETFSNSVAPGEFEQPVTTFQVLQGQKAVVTFGVGSSAMDIKVPVAPGLSLPFHYDALTFKGASVVSTISSLRLDDPDLSDGALFTVLTPGSYILTFQGTSATGGFYAGNYSVTMSAVPEPDALALVLAGAGLAALVARRRRG